ncbi:MAG: acyltransferase [Oscillospiraceae bacterium]|nr:acyltransferase [Oscillospiraceae bacterium]
MTVCETALCLIVIFLHVAAGYIGGGVAGRFTKLMLVSVHFLSFAMPGFVFMSAMKQTLKYEAAPFEYGRFMLGRLRRVYAPYVIWTAVYYAFFTFVAHYFPFRFGDLLVYILNGTLSAQFYFVIIVMQFYLITPLLAKFARRVKPVPGLVAALLVTAAAKYFQIYFPAELMPMPADYFFPMYMIYWMLGVYCGLCFENFTRFAKKRAAWLIAAFAAVAALHLPMMYRAAMGASVYRLSEYVHILYRSCAVVALFAAAETLRPLSGKLARAVESLHARTFSVYLSHVLVLVITTRAIDAIFPSLSPLIRFIFIAAPSFAVPFALAYAADWCRGAIRRG